MPIGNAQEKLRARSRSSTSGSAPDRSAAAIYAPAMRRLLLLTALIAFLTWRARRLDESDRRNGFGAYAPVIPSA